VRPLTRRPPAPNGGRQTGRENKMLYNEATLMPWQPQIAKVCCDQLLFHTYCVLLVKNIFARLFCTPRLLRQGKLPMPFHLSYATGLCCELVIQCLVRLRVDTGVAC